MNTDRVPWSQVATGRKTVQFFRKGALCYLRQKLTSKEWRERSMKLLSLQRSAFLCAPGRPNGQPCRYFSLGSQESKRDLRLAFELTRRRLIFPGGMNRVGRCLRVGRDKILTFHMNQHIIFFFLIFYDLSLRMHTRGEHPMSNVYFPKHYEYS